MIYNYLSVNSFPTGSCRHALKVASQNTDLLVMWRTRGQVVRWRFPCDSQCREAQRFSLGFLGGEETPVDVVMNYIFLADCALNFRTGYTDNDGLEVRGLESERSQTS